MNKLLYIYTESVLPQPDLNVAVLAQLLRQWTPDGNIMSSNPSTTKQDPWARPLTAQVYNYTRTTLFDVCK